LFFQDLLIAHFKHKKSVISLATIIIALSISLCQVNNGYCVENWRNGDGAETVLGSINPGTIDSAIYDNIVAPLDNFLADGRFGCKLAYSSASELTVGIGSVVCSNTSGSIRLMARNSSATTVDWDDIDTGSEAASTTYYVYAVMSAVSDTTFTIKVSESSSLPSGVTYYLRLGYFTNDSDSNITSIVDDRDSVIPSGVIVMWSGTTSDIPTGWVLCDGDNGTPDLTDRFVIGAGNLATPGASGGGTIGGTESSLTCTATAATGAELRGDPGYHPIFTVSNVINPYYALAYIQKL